MSDIFKLIDICDRAQNAANRSEDAEKRIEAAEKRIGKMLKKRKRKAK